MTGEGGKEKLNAIGLKVSADTYCGERILYCNLNVFMFRSHFSAAIIRVSLGVGGRWSKSSNVKGACAASV